MQTRALFFKPGFTGLTAFKPGYPGLTCGSLVSGSLADSQIVYYKRFQAFSFLCTFVPGSEKSTERTFAPVEHSLLGTFAPVELSFLGSESSKNFRSVEHSLPWNFGSSGRERTFQERCNRYTYRCPQRIVCAADTRFVGDS